MLIFALVIFIMFRIQYIGFVPIWDAFSITKHCVLEGKLNCHHPSMGYLFLLTMSQRVDFGNQYLLNSVNLLLAIIALLFFYKIILLLFSKMKLHRWEPALLTLLLAFNPLFFAHSISPTLDFGVLVFFLASFYGLLYQKTFFTIISMIFLVFSKEPGILLYATLISLYGFITLYKKVRSSKELVPYLIPTGLFIIYSIYQTNVAQQPVFWRSNFNLFLTLPFENRKWILRIVTRIIQTFILNFHWIYTTVFSLFLLTRLKKMHLRNRYWLIILACFIVYMCPVFYYNTYTLPRYIVPLVPLLILLFSYTLTQLINRSKKRLVILCIILVLSFTQTFYTIDPISRAIFGTFDFGNHKMLRMISLVDECCGYAGKDQLVYNTEFTVIDTLISRLYQTIHLTPKVPLFIGDIDAAEQFIPADMKTLSRTLRTNNIIVPTIYLTTDLPYFSKEQVPKHAYFVYLPWSDILSKQVDLIEPYYSIGRGELIDYRGYQLTYYPLTKK